MAEWSVRAKDSANQSRDVPLVSVLALLSPKTEKRERVRGREQEGGSKGECEEGEYESTTRVLHDGGRDLSGERRGV